MIKNQPYTIHDELRNSKFEFYLTGSRYLGGANDNSDWDYFTQNSPGVRDFLQRLGFKHDLSGYYDDPLIVSVMCSGDVHVQLCLNVESKERVQWTLKNNGVRFDRIPKDQARRIWAACLQLYEATCD